MAEKMGFVIPFKKALKSENAFVIQNENYSKEGKTPVAWSFTTIHSQEWKSQPHRPFGANSLQKAFGRGSRSR